MSGSMRTIEMSSRWWARRPTARSGVSTRTSTSTSAAAGSTMSNRAPTDTVGHTLNLGAPAVEGRYATQA